MPGIPSDMYSRLRETLLECGPFNNDTQLRAVFANASLSPWRTRIPEASNPADRVESTIHFLMDKYHSKNRTNALVLLLEVLRDRIDQNDACYDRLTNIAEELRNLFQSNSSAVQTHNEPAKTIFLPQVVGSSVFISYSHKDTKYLQEFKTHLQYYIRQNNIDAWDDTRIAPGSNWQEAIEKALRSAKVAVLLISADFLASDFIANNELPPLLTAAEQRNLTILSVIVRPSAFGDTELARLQTVNVPSNPIAKMPLAKRDGVWSEAAKLVWNILREPLSNS